MPLFILSLLCNLAGALMEGAAYCLLILALSLAASESHPFLTYLPSAWEFPLLITLALLAQLAKSAFCFAALACCATVCARWQYSSQERLFERMIWMPFSALSEFKQGKLAEIVRAPASYFRPLLDAWNHLVVGLLMVVMTLGVMITLSLSLTAVTLLFFSMAFFFQRWLMKKTEKLSTKLTGSLQSSGESVAESLQGVKTIHLFGLGPHLLEKMRPVFKRAARANRKILLWMGALTAINEVVAILFVALCLAVGMFFVQKKGYLSYPLLFSFVAVAYRLTAKVQLAWSGLSEIAAQSGFQSQTRNFLVKPLLNEDRKPYVSFHYALSFKDVSFTYPSTQQEILSHLSFDIPLGGLAILRGPSGVGKSTVIDLICGLYQPSQGTITLDGTSLMSFDLEAWRENIGVVSQELFLFDGTIEENIRLTTGASQAQVVAAAKRAHAHSFILSLPQGYQSRVGERGGRLSGGQRQRIALARAFVRNPQVLILDEATNQVDHHTEKKVLQAVAEYPGTRLIVTHRPESVLGADVEIVLGGAPIVAPCAAMQDGE